MLGQSTICPVGKDYGAILFYQYDVSRSDIIIFLRINLYDDILVVGYPVSISHEILSDLFHRLSNQGMSYSSDGHNGVTIMQGGSAGIELSRGRKEPDFSLYEVRTENYTEPSIAGEVACSETAAELANDAARLLCPTKN